MAHKGKPRSILPHAGQSLEASQYKEGLSSFTHAAFKRHLEVLHPGKRKAEGAPTQCPEPQEGLTHWMSIKSGEPGWRQDIKKIDQRVSLPSLIWDTEKLDLFSLSTESKNKV